MPALVNTSPRRNALAASRLIAIVVLASVVVAGALLLSVAASARAEVTASTSGGSRYWSNSKTGGIEPGVTPPAKKAKKKRVAPPVITGFKLVAATLFDEGRPLKLRYRIKARARKVRVKLLVRTADGKYVKTVSLGVHRTQVLQTTELTRAELGVTGVGGYKVRLTAADGKGRRAARGAKVPAWLPFSFSDHRFPLVGQFGWGGEDADFGSGRPGHTHQGQDLTAAEGTPIVAPYGGSISYAQYQASGAGWYVVLAATDGRDYVFMHLKAGSIEVKAGEVVPTGKLLGRVGSTGVSSGPHLHFEIWTGGPWQFGGKPIDPRPLLDAWFLAAPGGATVTPAGT
ncbi:MAG: M23 family metallopeptidase, partial [Solirubrobacterales bacterium]